MKFSSTIVTFAVNITATLLLASFVLGEECDQEEFSKCAEPLDMLQLTPDFSIGVSKKGELDKLCHKLRKGLRCIQSYTRRCMDLEQRNQFNKLYHGTNQFIRDLCNKGEFQEEYLQHAPCTELAKKEFEECSDKHKDTMIFINPSKNNEQPENITMADNVRTICCSINELVDCSEQAAKKICGNNAAKFTRELVKKFSATLTKLYCDNFVRHPELCNEESKGSTIIINRIFSSIIVLMIIMKSSFLSSFLSSFR